MTLLPDSLASNTTAVNAVSSIGSVMGSKPTSLMTDTHFEKQSSYQITIDSALEITRREIKQFVSNPVFTEKMNQIFGDNWDHQAMQNLIQDWESHNFKKLADIDILTGTQLKGANGAFCGETDSIFISEDFLKQNAGNIQAVADVLLEEIGHKIDAAINESDTLGDEGELFQRLVQNQSVSALDLATLSLENDHSTLQMNGKTFAIEMSRIAAATFNGKLYQSIRGTDNNIYIRSSSDGQTWSSWQHKGGAALSAPEFAVFNARLYQTVRGTDNNVYIRSTADGTNWTNWVANGATRDTPELEVFNGRLYQTVRGTDNNVYIRSTTDGFNWTNWVANGATLDTPELEPFNGRLYQTVQGTDNNVYIRSTADGFNWTNWVANGATLKAPELEVFGNRLYQTVQGTDNQVYLRSTSDGITWTGWIANGATLDSPELKVFNGRLYQTVRGTDSNVYVRSTGDGNNWTNWFANGATLSTPTFTVFNNSLVQSVEGTNSRIYTRTLSNAPGAAWGAWQEVGGGFTFREGYLSELNSMTDNAWDLAGGESAQYGKYESYTNGDLQQSDMSPTLLKVYEDLSISIFGVAKVVTSGYAYDRSYLNSIGSAHAGIDIGASNGTPVKSATHGIVATTYNASYGGVVGIDEIDSTGTLTGRRWWYVHVTNIGVSKGQRVTAGQTTLAGVGQGHLHLAITGSGQAKDPANGTGVNPIGEVLSRTISPLQAFWKYKNDLR